MDTRFRHCWSIDAQWPQALADGGSKRLFDEDVPWSARYARGLFEGDRTGMAGELEWLTAAIDEPGGRVVGSVLVQPPGYVQVNWHPPETEKSTELSMSFRQVDPQIDYAPDYLTHVGFGAGELTSNAGRVRLTHVDYRHVRDDGSVEMANWIIGGDCTARKSTTWWVASRTDRTSELTDYEDVYGLVPDDLWFDYPEFDRYDHLIFRDAPVLEKLGVPEEIRLKPVPAMPPEVV